MENEKDTGMSLDGVPIVPGEETDIDKANKSNDIRNHHHEEVRDMSQAVAGTKVLREVYTRGKNYDVHDEGNKGEAKVHYLNIEKEGITPMLLLKEKYAGLVKPKLKHHGAMVVIFNAYKNGDWFTPKQAIRKVRKAIPGFKVQSKKNPSADVTKILGPLASDATGIGLLEWDKKGKIQSFRLTPQALELGPLAACQFALDCKKEGPWNKKPKEFISYLRTQAKSEAAKAELMPYETTHSGKPGSIQEEAAKAGLHAREISDREFFEKCGIPDDIINMIMTRFATKALPTEGKSFSIPERITVDFNINFNVNMKN